MIADDMEELRFNCQLSAPTLPARDAEAPQVLDVPFEPINLFDGS